MKAIVARRFGAPEEVLEIAEVERPRPGMGEVLLRVCASSVNPADLLGLAGRPYVMRPVMFGWRKPKYPIPGHDAAGIVAEVGAGVTTFRPGDEVYGEVPGGAYAEYVTASADKLAAKPASVGFAEAAAVPIAGVTALQGIRDRGEVDAGQRVLINGASGGVGTFAVQLAKARGAHVTGVCGSRNIEVVRAAGADEVIDYAVTDCTRGPDRYDVVFDLAGNHPSSAYRRVLAPGGTYVSGSGKPGGPVLGPLPFILRVLLGGFRPGPRMRVLAAAPNPTDLTELAELIDAGKVTPIIDRTYPLADAPAALARRAAGEGHGKTIITC
ncbi:NAD(P)-dependent alcohol dehydrogenase [Nocardia rhizosphaerae]|uniref:NAD(P)-dependent alcohol dehydrogenase n=1 Tax=Nocardia rhizosphaerae TaxID=1691571 RepID=A0ABV8L7T9_9NOCA